MNKIKHFLTRVGDALKSNTKHAPHGAPETAPEGAHILGEMPQSIRGMWLQREQLIDERKKASDDVAELRRKLEAAELHEHAVSRHLKLANDTIVLALDDTFGHDTPSGAIGVTTDWTTFVQTRGDGLAGIMEKLLSGKRPSGADIFKSMPEELREHLVPKGYKVVELDELPDDVAMKLEPLGGIGADSLILYNEQKRDVRVISAKIGGHSIDDELPDFLSGMFGREKRSEGMSAH